MNRIKQDGRILNQKFSSVRFILGELQEYLGCERVAFSRALSFFCNGEDGMQEEQICPYPPRPRYPVQPINDFGPVAQCDSESRAPINHSTIQPFNQSGRRQPDRPFNPSGWLRQQPDRPFIYHMIQGG